MPAVPHRPPMIATWSGGPCGGGGGGGRQVVFEPDAHAGLLVGAAGRADRHPLGHAAAAMDAAASPGSCFGGRGPPLSTAVIVEEGGRVGRGPGREAA